MSKTEWATPKLEVLSTRKTATGGQGANDTFHTALSADGALPSQEVGGPS